MSKYWKKIASFLKKFSLTKQKTRPRINHLKPFKKIAPKNRKNSKSRSQIAACEQKTTSEKAKFCSNNVFSIYFKIRAKKCTPQNHSLFRSTSCFGVTKITTPI